MLTQQDIYATGSENRPQMLNKENYVSWSSRLLRYAKSRPNGKLIYNSIINGLYVRRMIPEPGDANLEVEANDQAIKTILLGLPEDIYAAVDSCETAQEIWLRVQEKQTLFKRRRLKWSRHVTIVHQTKNLHTTDYTQLYDFLKYNQKEVDDLRAERLAKSHDPLALMANSNNPFTYPVFHKINHHQVVQNAVQNPGVQNVGKQSGLIVVPGIANQNLNGNGNVVAVRVEGNATGNNADLDEIEKVNANCILMANLQQTSTPGTQTDKASVYDSDGSVEHKALELEIERLLRAIVSQDIMSIVQSISVVDTSNLQIELEQCKYDKISYDKAYNDMHQKIERLQAQLGDLKGKIKDTSSVSNTLDQLSQKLENENVKLDF
nr:hypothetical protein [Tanacetum cinerariifolium]